MIKKNNSTLVVILLFWCATAYAQHVTRPAFGDELLSYSKQTWFFVGCFTLAGMVWRIVTELKPGRPSLWWHGYLSIFTLCPLAAFIGFYACEQYRLTDLGRLYPLLDGVQGGVITVFAYNREKWLMAFSRGVEAQADKVTSMLKERKP